MQDDYSLNPAFLRLVAKDLIDRFGNELAATTVVFPSLRARLFFNNYLYHYVQQPVWTPQYTTLDAIYGSVSPLRPADPIQLIGELYQSYIQVFNSRSATPSTETFDEFYFFGETLLNDFDDIDKNRVNARLLFSNLQDLDQLRDDLTYLSENQIEALMQRFNRSFHGDTMLKAAFWNIWSILGEVYTTFKTKLQNKGIAYPGMLMRSVVEDEAVEFAGERYVFVGFNVLNRCEQDLFRKLKDKALFYWDYDTAYLNTEAGKYIAANIRQFGSALEPSCFESLYKGEKRIRFMASPSESAQTAAIAPWIDEMKAHTSFVQPDSAIVLCNEAILPVVIHSIPSHAIDDVNITMGFPLTQTPVNGFILALTEMQMAGSVAPGVFRYKYVLPVLRHPYGRLLFPEADKVEQEIIEHNIFFPDKEVLQNELLFKSAGTTEDLVNYLLAIIRQLGICFGEEESYLGAYHDLYNESVFRAFQVLNRLSGLIYTGDWVIEKPTFLRLLRKLLSTVKIPFHGEPVKGLQVMGVLETRTLDFDNLLLLSVNEGFMPGTSNENSFIPEFLRKHFGLSTLDHQDAIYAYYFYRLIQRARNITLVYNTDKTQTGKAEMSRFLLQMLIDPRLKDRIRRFSLQAAIQPWQGKAIEIVKTEALTEKIRNRYDVNRNRDAYRLSPTALNTFISCSFKFYLQYIEDVKTPEDISDELDSSVFGSIFHRAAEYLYKQLGHIPEEEKFFSRFTVEKERLQPYLEAPHLVEKLVSRAFIKEYFKGKEIEPKDYDGQQLIKYKIIVHLIKRLIRFDQRRAPFTILGLEYPVTTQFTLDDQDITIRTGGIIDRLEEYEGKLCIVDYKSSGTGKTCKELSELFEQKEKRAAHIFQTFVYASALLNQTGHKQALVPALLYLQQAAAEDYSPVILCDRKEVDDFREKDAEFVSLLKEKIAELFDPAKPFTQTEVAATCEYCEFKEMCNR